MTVIFLLCLSAPCAYAIVIWETELVDSTGGTGRTLSMALDSTNQPVIAFGRYNVGLFYVSRNGGSWGSIEEVDASGNMGGINLVMDGNDPMIAYTYSGEVRYIEKNGTWGSSQKIDDGNTDMKAMALDPDNGNPAITYGYVQYAAWNGSSWDIENFDGGQGNNSLAFNNTGDPQIAYRKFVDGNYKLHYIEHNGTSWDSPVNVDTSAAKTVLPSLAVDSSTGNPAISYWDETNGNLKYAWYDSGWQTPEIVDGNGDLVGTNSFLVMDSEGNPHITYTNITTSSLMYAEKIGGAWNIQTVVSGGVSQDYVSMAIDESTGNYLIAYRGNGLFLATGTNVPEPSTVVMMGVLLGGGWFVYRRKSKRPALNMDHY
ncbi:PEP-CTERM sorting domain-containing protein [Candidatus Auribacterota bacterium]